jgi:hypothetical protein
MTISKFKWPRKMSGVLCAFFFQGTTSKHLNRTTNLALLSLIFSSHAKCMTQTQRSERENYSANKIKKLGHGSPSTY